MRLTVLALACALFPMVAQAQAQAQAQTQGRAAAQAQLAASPAIMQAVQTGHFAQAESMAAATGDPLMSKLVEFFKLLDPGGGSADDIQEFIAQNPDWPDQGLLALRAAQAAGLSGGFPEMTPPFITQVQTLHLAGQDAQAAALWVSDAPAAAAASDPGQLAMFWPAQNTLARALLLTGDAKTALSVVLAVAPSAAGSTREQATDRDFLAGFLLLRFLHQPAQAASWFHQLAADSGAVITQARAYYWLGRSETGAASLADYHRAADYPDTYYGQLAAGALGLSPAALTTAIQQVGEPAITAGQAFDFALMELPRAAALLVQMGDTHDAQTFLVRLGQVAADDRGRELAARLATGLGLPPAAVFVARTAGVAGQMLVREGWPIPFNPPTAAVEPAASLAIMRQESSFDPTVISGSGAVGLMQLLPSTARMVARQNGLAATDLFDPGQNMSLGSTYLGALVAQFGNCLPLAFAAYNAGPNNVTNWIGEYGDPQLGAHNGGANIIDWIEEIPFNETRNYVQRVTENMVVYRALEGLPADSPVAPWLAR
jgi:soluble lytic murein transglycosylase-like protein